MANNNFLKATDLLAQNDNLNYLNHGFLKEDNKEFLRTDLWDFEFIVPPAAVYFPGNDLMRARLVSVDPSIPAGVGEITAIIRGFTIRQATISGTTSGTVTLNFIDREDQAISAFIDDWRDKLGGRENRFAFRKEFTIAEATLTQFNTSREPIRRFTLHTLQPSGDAIGTLNTPYSSDDPAQGGTCALTLTFEHFTLDWENV